MAANMEDSKKLTDLVTAIIEDYRSMVDQEDPSGESKYGFIPGLGMLEEAKMLGKKIDELKQGLFQVLFIGPFSAGKSTLINALLGKNLLRSGINPETAVISKIVFGDHEGIKVFRKYQQEPEEYTIEEFFEKFRVEQGNEAKFDDVDYVLISQQSSVFDRSIQLTDSPGLQNTATEDKIAKEFAQRADAIVFLTHGTEAWQVDERDYIAKNFAKKNLDNVFFIVTYADQIPEDEMLGFVERCKNVLSDVFTDENGSFDEKKFNERVFYVDGYGALCARTGIPHKIGRVTVPVKEEETGIAELQDALYRFLGADDKDKAALSGFVVQLENVLETAKGKIEKILNNYGRDRDQTEAERDRYQEAINKLEIILQNINDACLTTAKNIAVTASSEYDDFVSRVENEWDEHFNTIEVDFGVKQAANLVKINMSRNSNKDEQIKELVQPITSAVSDYISDQSKTLVDAFSANSSKQIADLSALLERYIQQIGSLDISIEDIIKEICKTYKIDISVLGTGKVNIGQVLVATLITGDPEGIMDGLTGNTPWSDFIKKAVVTTVGEVIGALIVSGLFGVTWIYLIGRLVVAAFRINNQSHSMARKCIDGSKEETIKSLKKAKMSYIHSIEDKFGNGLVERTASATDFILQKVQESKNDLDAVLRNLESQNFKLESEKKRFSAIAAKMQALINAYRAYVN